MMGYYKQTVIYTVNRINYNSLAEAENEIKKLIEKENHEAVDLFKNHKKYAFYFKEKNSGIVKYHRY